MNKEIEQLRKELQGVVQKINGLDQAKNSLVIRSVEIQGIIKYLEGCEPKPAESPEKKEGK